MSDELREALQRAAVGGEPAVGDAFARFAVVKRRAAIARSATVAVVGLAAAATLLFTLPGLNSGDTGLGLTRGDASPSTAFRTTIHYEDRILGFQLDYPSDWSIRAEEGSFVRLLPPYHRATASTMHTGCQVCATAELIAVDAVAVDIRARLVDDASTSGVTPIPRDELAALRSAGARIVSGPTTEAPAGADILSYGVRPDLTAVREPFELRWWTGATVVTTAEAVGPRFLRFEVASSDPGDRARLERDITLIRRSLREL